MSGLIGRKVGMTSVFNQDGKQMACTVVEVGPNVVTQVKTVETDGYNCSAKAAPKVLNPNPTIEASTISRIVSLCCIEINSCKPKRANG